MRIGNTVLSYGLIAGGLGLLAALFTGLELGSWPMPFPWSLVVAVLAALPAAGLSMLYSAAGRNHLQEESVND